MPTNLTGHREASAKTVGAFVGVATSGCDVRRLAAEPVRQHFGKLDRFGYLVIKIGRTKDATGFEPFISHNGNRWEETNPFNIWQHL
jgi:hypothetical protein